MKFWCAWVLALVVQGAGAQPASLRLIVGYPAGGPADLVARRLEARLAEVAQVSTVIENGPGAGGGLAVQRVLDPDARDPRWLIGSISETVVAPLLNPALNYRPDQLRLIGIAAGSPVALVGAPGLQPTELAALLDSARAPGAPGLTFGSFGQGSLTHLFAEDFARRTGIGMVHVPYAGMQPLLRDLVGGHVNLAFVPMAAGLLDVVAQGKLRLYALATPQRDAARPAVPTVDEAARLSGFHRSMWVGLFVPAQMPQDAQRRARQALAVALGDPQFQRLQRAEGSQPADPMGAEEAARRYDAEIAYIQGLLATLRR